MALAVGGEYRHAALTRDHLVAEIEEWGLRAASDLVDGALHHMREVLAVEVPAPSVREQMHDRIRLFTDNLLAGRMAGCGSAA
ncbi:type II toxin-antitoxin system HipA family toxin [Nocardia cyriacigeorgica]|uniref:Type II toxin-antitoxin system HipA family toxin n=1 Tax=Nocardia cyriacigeorgica TaxID=135487 RepID=A0A6P1D4E4_9NOCA|nr:type II toxin-antitoxin system HipA family toxin [Nocardia cyriacigeorgica]NEW41056.1 type II toxin-antitoxin system HipA family toxin [Nocardia cyriacigeorgica]NEW44321.1 type II toxin-antitoxin system HipA family toxin [Nocardia cyriacigeorgica]NEW52940.1 type II toxin-antitoxin system HipA family toxin [Nocardia cyriacigeorgica]